MSKAIHPCGVVFLDKPMGWTSRQAVNHVIRIFSSPGQKNRKQRPKAGHAGTLDPLATGMLPILLGEATRFAAMGLNAEKIYEVSFDLSLQTDTLDLEGKETFRAEHVDVSLADLQAVLAKFRGVIQQIPPIYSAIMLDGQRAHDRARKGENITMSAREVEIYGLELLSLEQAIVRLHVHCSKGTYIRALARDIGQALGMGGCVTSLRRISSGGWPEHLMVSVEELEEKKDACILPLPMWLRELPALLLQSDDAVRFVKGQRLVLAADERLVAVAQMQVLCGDVLLGTAAFGEMDVANQRAVLQPQRVLPSAQEFFV